MVYGSVVLWKLYDMMQFATKSQSTSSITITGDGTMYEKKPSLLFSESTISMDSKTS